jgi:phenylacetic acid degradation operon negative regulatory protein
MDDYPCKRELSPRNIILDLMGVSHPNPLEAAHLPVISHVFSVPVNNLRVALTRLAAKGMLDNTQRGVYRLSAKAIVRNEFTRRWKTPQHSNMPWDTSWIACHLSKGTNRSLRHKSINALNWFGFKPGLDGLWVRPNNLVQSVPKLLSVLRSLGLEAQAPVFSINDIEPTLAKSWKTLWATQELDTRYQQLNEKLINSFKQLQSAQANTTLLETCLLGSEAIHLLATDPHLPPDIRASQHYEKLRTTMLEYDQIGRKIWLKKLPSLGVLT